MKGKIVSEKWLLEHRSFKDSRFTDKAIPVVRMPGQAEVIVCSLGAPAEDCERIAHIIAAAPDLLAALEGLFEQCAMIHRHWGDGDNIKAADAAVDTARAAMAKAKGVDR